MKNIFVNLSINDNSLNISAKKHKAVNSSRRLFKGVILNGNWVMTGCSLLLLILFSNIFVAYGQQHKEKNLPAADSVDVYLKKAIDSGFSGIVLIAKGDEILLHESYSSDPAILKNSVFWIGSLTKSITATAILNLQEKGKLKVADPIYLHLSGVPNDKKHISIHHLLTHTSGLGTHYSVDEISVKDDAIKTLLSLPVDFTPGEFEYSNDGYNLLALVISETSGETYESYIKKGLFEPAGMNDSGFWAINPDSVNVKFASVKSNPKIDKSTWGYKGATGLYSSAGDLFKWHKALKNNIILSSPSKNVMYAPHVQFSLDIGYGYGWEINTEKNTRLLANIGANNELDHYTDFKYFEDEDIIFILFSNSTEDRAFDIFSGLEKVFFKIYRDNP